MKIISLKLISKTSFLIFGMEFFVKILKNLHKISKRLSSEDPEKNCKFIVIIKKVLTALSKVITQLKF